MMTGINIIKTLSGTAVLLSLTSCGADKKADTRYNIVYIMTDDMMTPTCIRLTLTA